MTHGSHVARELRSQRSGAAIHVQNQREMPPGAKEREVEVRRARKRYCMYTMFTEAETP